MPLADSGNEGFEIAMVLLVKLKNHSARASVSQGPTWTGSPDTLTKHKFAPWFRIVELDVSSVNVFPIQV